MQTMVNSDSVLAASRNEDSPLLKYDLLGNPILPERIKLESRRYIGCKAKLLDWIFEVIDRETNNVSSFCDIFAGTGAVANRAVSKYDYVVVNDFLYSNNVIYKAFFQDSEWSLEKVSAFVEECNRLNAKSFGENYFSENFGGKFFDYDNSKIIGHIREEIERHSDCFTEKEKAVLLASLIYSIDSIANTIGHFDAYIKKEIKPRKFVYRLVDVQNFHNVEIHQLDSNKLARTVCADLTYIDPPYNSRQYSRFYHVYENLVQWKKPRLFGTAMKPAAENMSEYCRTSALNAFVDLVSHLNSKYLVVSYNNTYNSKSKSSANRITLEQMENVLNACGSTNVFSKSYTPFNSGKTEFADHREYLFITEVDNEKRSASFPSLLCGG